MRGEEFNSTTFNKKLGLNNNKLSYRQRHSNSSPLEKISTFNIKQLSGDIFKLDERFVIKKAASHSDRGRATRGSKWKRYALLLCSRRKSQNCLLPRAALSEMVHREVIIKICNCRDELSARAVREGERERGRGRRNESKEAFRLILAWMG